MNKMNTTSRLLALLLAALMVLSLAACGGPDKQPAIDAYNELAVKNFRMEGLTVPEPSSAAAALLGLGSLCLTRKRR